MLFYANESHRHRHDGDHPMREKNKGAKSIHDDRRSKRTALNKYRNKFEYEYE